MSDQPSSSQPTSSASDREVEGRVYEDAEETQPGQIGVKEHADLIRMIKEWELKLERESEFVKVLKESVSKLEYEAVMMELDFRKKKLDPADIVVEFRKESEEAKKQMLKRSFFRRNLVASLYEEYGTNQNETMQAIKKITFGKNKSPVAMEEIEYCIRRRRANEPIDVNIHIDVLLKDEEIMNWIYDRQYVDKFVDSLQPKTTIDYVDIRVKSWRRNISFLEIRIGATSWSHVFRNKDADPDYGQHKKTMDFFDACVKKEAKIKELKLTVGYCRMSNAFLKDFMECRHVTEFEFETFELQHYRASVSDTLKACKNIKCTNLKITSCKFMDDEVNMIFEAMKSCKESVRSWCITSKEMIPDEIIARGRVVVDPYFEVTLGFDEKTGQKCVLFEKSAGPMNGKCKWKSFN